MRQRTVPDVRYTTRISGTVAELDLGVTLAELKVSSRDRILDATARILVRDGGNAVTIAAVAAEAGVSKGGLFYHFASKELLIDGLVARYVESFDALLESASDAPGEATRAYLRSVAGRGGVATQPVIALLAASIVHPSALAALRARYERWQDRLAADGLPSGVATTVRFAVDGIWLADALDLAPARGEERARVIEKIESLLG